MKRESEYTEKAQAWGRWSEEEHTRFLKGITLYGRNWVKVASFVKTRTSTQVRSHAQKHDMKQNEVHETSSICGLSVDKATQYGSGVMFII